MTRCPKSGSGCGVWCRGSSTTTRCPGTGRVCAASVGKCAGCGFAGSGVAANVSISPGLDLLRLPSTGYPAHAFSIRIPMCVSTPFIRGKSRVREFRQHGSVRGASGNRRLYRDSSKMRAKRATKDRSPASAFVRRRGERAGYLAQGVTTSARSGPPTRSRTRRTAWPRARCAVPGTVSSNS